MVKMRTESANFGGGRLASQSDRTMKSEQDVEAAFAIAQLSDVHIHGDAAASVRRPNGHTWTPPSDNSSSPTRFSHIRSAVMPFTHSRVERVLKRRHDDVHSHPHPSKISTIRTVTDTDKSIFVPDVHQDELSRRVCEGEQTRQQELVGRFVRTCKPSGRDVVVCRPYVTVSQQVVSPTLVSSTQSFFTNSCSQIPTDRHSRTSGLPPAMLNYPSSVLPRPIRTLPDHQCGRQWVEGQSVPSLGGHSYHKEAASIPRLPVAEKLCRTQQYRLSPKETKPTKDSEMSQRLPSSAVSAYYNLGQSVAASQFLMLKSGVLPNTYTSPVPHSSHRLTQLQCSPPTTACLPPSQPKCVDSRTLRKVRRGEFGSLSTLRHYCDQLRRHSAPDGSVEGPSETAEQSTNDDDVAVDLSMKKHRWDTDSGNDHLRPTRSCGNSPVERQTTSVDLYQQLAQSWTSDHGVQPNHLLSSMSLPCSPYTGQEHKGDISVKQEFPRHEDVVASGGDLETTLSDDTGFPDVIPDNQLPLKKRRVVYTSPSPLTGRSGGTPVHRETTDSTYRQDGSMRSAVLDDQTRLTSAERELYCQAAVLARDNHGDLPLHTAVAKGTVAKGDVAASDIISLMSALGVSLDYCNDRRQTALHLAVLTDQCDLVRRLLVKGASPNIRDDCGQTVVHVAVSSGHNDCLRLILDQSQLPVNVDALNYSGETALHRAVLSENVGAVQCLLSAGADADIADTKYRRTPLFYAVERHNVAITDLLMSYGARTTVARDSAFIPGVPESGYTRLQSSQAAGKCSVGLQDKTLPCRQPACCPTG